MSRKKHKRLRCPKCGSKNVKLHNKEQQIWQCKRESCSHLFLYDLQTNTKIALTPKDVQMQDPNSPIPKEEIESMINTQQPTDGLDDLAKKLGITL